MDEHTAIPFKAWALSMTIILASLLLGVLTASWILPVCVAVHGKGLDGLRQISVEWGFASAPLWLDAGTRRWLPFAGGVLGLALGILFGILGGKLAHHLLIYKLGWMTEEQARQFNARTPRF